MEDNQMYSNITSKLKSLGAVAYNLMLPETKALPKVLHPNEDMLGVVYGKYVFDKDHLVSRGMLVSTDQRVFLINKKFLYRKLDELSYEIISGVTYSRIGLAGTVALHTRLGDISVRTFNHKAARIFVEAIEAKIFPTKA